MVLLALMCSQSVNNVLLDVNTKRVTSAKDRTALIGITPYFITIEEGCH